MRAPFITILAIATSTCLLAAEENSWRPWEARYMPWNCSLTTSYGEYDERPWTSIYVAFGRLMDKALHSETYKENTDWQEFTRNAVEEGELSLLLSVSIEAFFDDPGTPVQAILINGKELDFLNELYGAGHRYFFAREPMSSEILDALQEGTEIQFLAIAEDGKEFEFTYPEKETIAFKVGLAQFNACTEVLSHNKSLKRTP